MKLLVKYDSFFLLILGVLLGGSFSYTFLSQNQSFESNDIRLPNSHYVYIDPLLDYVDNRTILPKQVRNTEKLIIEYIEESIADNRITNASVFYRDLKNGPHFSLNHDVLYTPASLLKLPILIAYLKKAEEDPMILQKEILYEQQIDTPKFPHFTEVNTITPGQIYTIQNLLELMIKYSDNEATILLLSELPQTHINKVYKDLSVPIQPIIDVYEPFITASQYASIFRILYNATYINREYSELGLRFLSETTYREGIRKHLPTNLLISSKFGVYETDKETNFHECGIIYSSRPYLLCIMTKGHSYTNQETAIAEISRLIFTNIAN